MICYAAPRQLFLIAMLFPFIADAFVLYGWNLKHLGRERFSTKHAASVLVDADLVYFQEVNTTISGRTKLRELRDSIVEQSEDTKKVLCMGISKRPSDGRERYAMLWNQKEIVRVDEQGKEHPCETNEFYELDLTTEYAKEIVREPAYVLLKDIKSKRTFMAATVHALPKGNGKTPALEIPLIVKSVDAKAKEFFGEKFKNGIVILGGDFNMSVERVAFKEPKELGYKPVLSSGPLTSLEKSKRELSEPYDNILIKVDGAEVKTVKPRVINLYKQFEELAISTIYNTISDHCPLRVEVEM